MKTIKVLGDRVLAVREVKETVREVKKTPKNGLYIPDLKEENIAKIVCVSDSIKDLKLGDIIYYSTDSGEIENYLVIEYKNILAKQ